MELLKWKARISVLWIFLAVGMSAMMFLYFMGPGVIEKIISGEMEGMQIGEGLMFLFAILWLIPLIMAFLSLTLKDSANRWTNFVLGILFAIFYVVDTTQDSIAGFSITMLVMGILAFAAAVLIAWHAWKLPKLEA